MMVQIGIFIVCLAVSAYFGVKATREAFTIVREQTTQKAAIQAPTDAEKQKAERARREISNFMTYTGKEQEGNYGD